MNMGSLPPLGQCPTRNTSGSQLGSWTEQQRLCLPMVPRMWSQEGQAPGTAPGRSCPPGLVGFRTGHTHHQPRASQAAQQQRICRPVQETRETQVQPESGRSPRGGNGNPLQYACLGDPMDRGTGQRRLVGYSPWGCRVGRDSASTQQQRHQSSLRSSRERAGGWKRQMM